jgi:hypothetical protein
MIVEIHFSNHKPMLFGDSYKKWDEQAEEFFRIYPDLFISILNVMISDSKWIGWGGLKWCCASTFQDELNREGCQDGEPNNPNPRKYADMKFYPNAKVFKKVLDFCI